MAKRDVVFPCESMRIHHFIFQNVRLLNNNIYFSPSLALLATAFVLGVTAAGESTSEGGAGEPKAAAAATDYTKTQTVEEYLKL